MFSTFGIIRQFSSNTNNIVVITQTVNITPTRWTYLITWNTPETPFMWFAPLIIWTQRVDAFEKCFENVLKSYTHIIFFYDRFMFQSTHTLLIILSYVKHSEFYFQSNIVPYLVNCICKVCYGDKYISRQWIILVKGNF